MSSTSYKIKSLLVVPPTDTPTPATTDGTGVKLPKLDVHMFDGNNTHWKQFWDQFTVAVIASLACLIQRRLSTSNTPLKMDPLGMHLRDCHTL